MRHSLRNVGMVALLLFLFLPSPAFAFVPRAGENVAFSQTIQDDLYIAGGTVTVTGTVDGDVTAAGGTVTAMGRVSGALLVGGGTVEIGGSVGRSLRAAGGTVRLRGTARAPAGLARGQGTAPGNPPLRRPLLAPWGARPPTRAVGRQP